MNVLLTCCGRKIYLIDEIKRALVTLFPDDSHNVFVTDSSSLSPSLVVADKGFLVPRIMDDGYVDFISRLCREENVDIVIPSKDMELISFAREIDIFTNTLVAVQQQSVVELCEDKILFYRELHQLFDIPEICTPKGVDEVSVQKPLVVKERGVGVEGGKGCKVCTSPEALTSSLDEWVDPVCQEYVDGEEYTVDALFKTPSEPVVIIPRQRVALRQNVSDVGLTVDDRELVELTARLGAELGLVGAINAQWMRDAAGKVWLIEVNPRISGGMQISLAACPDYVQAMLAVHFKLPVEPLPYESDVLTMKYDSAVSKRLSDGQSSSI